MDRGRIVKTKKHGIEFLVSEEDYQDVIEVDWRVSGGKPFLYIQGTYKSKAETKSVSLHRVLTGALPGELVDHINGNTLDNRRSNLRICTRAQNSMNSSKKYKKKTATHKGVHWNKQKKKWKAEIRINYKKQHLGFYLTQEEAALAYNKKAIELFGEFARLNKI